MLVGAAGNDGVQTKLYPAGYNNVISVAASDISNARGIWNPGQLNGESNFGAWIDIAAPGKEIVSTVAGHAYGVQSGTSMAAPHVSGAAALLASRGLSNCEIVATLLHDGNVDDLPGDWLTAGQGRLNAASALNNPKDCIVPSAMAPDFNNDGRDDGLHICCTNKVRVWLGNPTPIFNVNDYVRPTGSTYPYQSGVWQTGDFDGDGRTDQIHIGAFNGNDADIWLANAGGFSPSELFFVPGYDTRTGFFLAWNVDLDADTDLIHICCSDRVKVWRSNGNGTFTISEFFPGYSLAQGDWEIGDFDGDGRGDLIHMPPGDTAKIWRSLGGGAFSITSFQPHPGYVLDAWALAYWRFRR